MARGDPAGRVSWCTTRVDGRRVTYASGGAGLPVLFLHGWGLGPGAYRPAIERLSRLGCRVLAPALPDLGGNEGLPRNWRTLAGYAGWAQEFLSSAGVEEPVVAAGHSLGGAVAARLAFEFPDRVTHLVMINSIGSQVWTERAGSLQRLDARPVWHWAGSFVRELVSDRAAASTLRAMVRDAVANLVGNPIGLWHTAAMARRAELIADLVAVREMGVPATVVGSSGDLIVPAAGFNDLCRALGVTGRVVGGGHSWLLGAPDRFAGVMLPVVTRAAAARTASAALRPGVVTRMDARRLAESG